MKFVYVITSSERDNYLEQALLSMHSLKLHNPDAHIALVTDEATVGTLDGVRATIRQYVDEMIAVAPPEEYDAKQRSRYLKTTLRRRVEGDFLYIDTDTIITAPLTGLENMDHDIYATLNAHIPDSYKNSLIVEKYSAITQQEFSLTQPYYNGGVFLVKDTPAAHKFFDDWHEIWSRERAQFGVSRDQMALAKANELNGGIVKELPPYYNCQIIMDYGWNYFADAKIIHYYAESPEPFYLFKEPSTYEKIKKEGITPEISDMVRFAKQRYLLSGHFLKGEEFDSYNLAMSVLGRKIARDHRWTNRIAYALYRVMGVKL